MARPASLSLVMPTGPSAVSSTITSPSYTGSDSPSPRVVKSIKNQDIDARNPKQISNGDPPTSPGLTSLPPFPTSPIDTPRHARETSRGFFTNLKASKSSNKVHQVEPTIRQVSEDLPRNDPDASENTIYSMSKSPGSTPDLSLSTSMDTIALENGKGKHFPTIVEALLNDTNMNQDHHAQTHKAPRRPVGASVASDSVIVSSPTETSRARKPKPRLAGLLTRTRSMRMDETGRRSKPSTPVRPGGPEIRVQYDPPSEDDIHQVSPKTAPLRQDKIYRDMMGSNNRNRSADRQDPSNHSQENIPLRRGDKSSSQALSTSAGGALREGGSSHLFMNIKNTSNKAAGGLGKASKSIFGKVSRSGSSNAKEEERYSLRVINLPLVQQTRHTRIASRLEDSKDKTEFWMPALPWRCIE